MKLREAISSWLGIVTAMECVHKSVASHIEKLAIY